MPFMTDLPLMHEEEFLNSQLLYWRQKALEDPLVEIPAFVQRHAFDKWCQSELWREVPVRRYDTRPRNRRMTTGGKLGFDVNKLVDDLV